MSCHCDKVQLSSWQYPMKAAPRGMRRASLASRLALTGLCALTGAAMLLIRR